MKDTKEEIQEELNEKQKAFCELYASSEEFFANGVQAYLEVYDIDRTKPNRYKTACVNASRLLSNAKVYNYINKILDDEWLNDNFVDKQLLFLIQQQDEKWVKLQAIKEYNNLKQRITKKIEVSWEINTLKQVPTEELLKKLNGE